MTVREALCKTFRTEHLYDVEVVDNVKAAMIVDALSDYTPFELRQWSRIIHFAAAFAEQK